MPELPEVETVARQLAPCVEGRVVRSVLAGNLELSPAITDIVITDLTPLASHDESSVYSILSARKPEAPPPA